MSSTAVFGLGFVAGLAFMFLAAVAADLYWDRYTRKIREELFSDN